MIIIIDIYTAFKMKHARGNRNGIHTLRQLLNSITSLKRILNNYHQVDYNVCKLHCRTLLNNGMLHTPFLI